MTNNREVRTEQDAYRPPEWLLETLRIYKEALDPREEGVDLEKVSPALQKRYREAGELAFTLAKLRNERQRFDFVPLSLAAYFQELGRVAGVTLLPVLAWLGISDFTLSGRVSVKALSRLARVIGLSCREAILLLRISFAQQQGQEPMLLAHRRCNGKPDSAVGKLEECEARLNEIELQFNSEVLRELRQLEVEVRHEYRDG